MFGGTSLPPPYLGPNREVGEGNARSLEHCSLSNWEKIPFFLYMLVICLLPLPSKRQWHKNIPPGYGRGPSDLLTSSPQTETEA